MAKIQVNGKNQELELPFSLVELLKKMMSPSPRWYRFS